VGCLIDLSLFSSALANVVVSSVSKIMTSARAAVTVNSFSVLSHLG
jgi:hypothetical protein